MAQASNDNLCELSLDLILGLPGETESSSNGVDLGLFGRFDGLRRHSFCSTGARLFQLGIF